MTAVSRLKRLVEPFWLGEALEHARACPDSERESLTELAQAARQRLEAAQKLSDERFLSAAIALEREGLLLVAKAAKLWPSAPVGDRAELDDLIAESAPERIIAGSLADQRAREAVLRKGLSERLGLLEIRPPRTILNARTARLTLLLGAVFAIAFGIRRFVAHTANIALYKPVSASSSAPGAQAANLTDGSFDKKASFSTRTEESPWVQVDLLNSFRIERVLIRTPLTTTPPEMLPLVLEGSTDLEHFTEIATRDDPFGKSQAWRVELGGDELRAVRVRRPGRGQLNLAEIQVIERR